MISKTVLHLKTMCDRFFISQLFKQETGLKPVSTKRIILPESFVWFE